jgi:3-phenylpropionate/trans-cinnamate dioxygenase ferredoxin subunit
VARYVVAEAGEIPPGGRKLVELDGRSIGVFHVNGEYFALLNWCPHQAARLCEGKLWSALEGSVPGDYQTSRDGEIIACPWHGWEFDLRTGQSWCDPERLRVRAYDVRIEPGYWREPASLGPRGAPPQPAAEGAGALATDSGAPAPGMVRGPYVAETYPVAAEGRYLVVDLGRPASTRPSR